jgi:hypothetical protein
MQFTALNYFLPPYAQFVANILRGAFKSYFHFVVNIEVLDTYTALNATEQLFWKTSVILSDFRYIIYYLNSGN